MAWIWFGAETAIQFQHLGHSARCYLLTTTGAISAPWYKCTTALPLGSARDFDHSPVLGAGICGQRHRSRRAAPQLGPAERTARTAPTWQAVCFTKLSATAYSILRIFILAATYNLFPSVTIPYTLLSFADAPVPSTFPAVVEPTRVETAVVAISTLRTL